MLFLVDAANQMDRRLAQRQPQLNDVYFVARTGCASLKKLMMMDNFKKSVVILCEKRMVNGRAFDEITGQARNDLRNFHQFLEKEKQVMKAGGFNTTIITEVMKKSDQLIHNVRGWRGDPKKLFDQINAVRDEACDLENFLKSNSRSRFLLTQTLIKEILIIGAKRLTLAVAGVGIIYLNLEATRILNSTESMASLALGGAFINQALPLLVK